MVAIATSALTLHQGIGHFETRIAATPTTPLPKFKKATLYVEATADTDDTITVDIWEKFGMRNLLGIFGYVHTTTDSVIVAEPPTTAVTQTDTTSSLVITIGGSAVSNKKRVYVIYGA